MTSPEQAIREALEPLARFAEVHDGPQGLGQVAPGGPQEDDYVWLCPSPGYPKIKTSDFRRARSALPLLDQMAAERERMERENERLSHALERDRSKVAEGTVAIRDAIASRAWLRRPGRGSYEWDDERYQQEFGAALDEIEKALGPLRAVASDWSDCPMDPAEIAAALAALTDQDAPHEVREGEWAAAWHSAVDTICTILGLPSGLSPKEACEAVQKRETIREPDYAKARLIYGPLSHDMLLQIIAEREAGIGFAGVPTPAPSSKAAPVAGRIRALLEGPIGNQHVRLELQSILSALAHPEPAPEGYRLAPVEPTQEMLNVAPASYSQSFRAIWPQICGDIYRAMITAAPQPGGER